MALTGPDISNPHEVKTVAGAKLSTLLAGELVKKDSNVRVISGNVLTGHKVSVEEGFLRYPYRQITAIDEENKKVSLSIRALLESAPADDEGEEPVEE